MADQPELPEQIRRKYVSRAPKPSGRGLTGPSIDELPRRLRLAWYESIAEAADNWLRVPRFSTVQDEPLGPNPYADNDYRRSGFDDASRYAKEQLTIFAARARRWSVETVAIQFGIKAGTILAAFGDSHENVTKCGRIIDYLADRTLKAAEAHAKKRKDQGFTSRLRTEMLEHRDRSVGEAYRRLRAEAEAASKPAPASPSANEPAGSGTVPEVNGNPAAAERARADKDVKLETGELLRRAMESLPSNLEARGFPEGLFISITDVFDAACLRLTPTKITGRDAAALTSTLALPLLLENMLDYFEDKFQAAERYGLGSGPELRARARERLEPRLRHWQAWALQMGQLIETRKAEARKAAGPGPGTAHAPASPKVDGAGGGVVKSSKGGKRGPDTDFDSAKRVAEIVKRVAPDGNWKDKGKLEKIRRALHDAGVPTPGTWGDLTWTEQVDPLVKKAIRPRLETAKKAQQETPA